MAEPEADRRDVDEAEETLGGLVVAGGDAAGVLQLVEAPLDEVAQSVEGAIHGHAQLAGLAHRDDRHHIACLHGFANVVRVIASVGEQDAGLGPSSSGTGFFINNTDILTAAHVIEGCAALALTDGSPLSVVAADQDIDLAVISAQRRSKHWLVLSDRAEPRLGESVFAIVYPYFGTLGQGLSVTGGNISALAGPDAGRPRIMISAAVQPGNSGGPILNRTGTVLGVVVSRLDDLVILENTGTLPQNINFAVPVDEVRKFLETAGVLFPQATAVEADLGDGIPPEVSGAVVAIQCLN